MTRTTLVRSINAPVSTVFQAISDIEGFATIIPQITKIEFLSESQKGAGVRFRETRLMMGKENTETLEVTEYVENECIRIVSDTQGSIWDSVFRVKQVGDQTELTLVMEAKAYKLLAKIFNPLAKLFLKKAIAMDMDYIKAHCEGTG